MKISLEVSIIDYSENAEELMGKCGLATTTSAAPTEFETNERDIKEFINIGKKMELSSVFNFPSIIYEIKDVSRSFTHQHVRHRMAAHMQQSLRYTEVNPNLDGDTFFVTPPSIVESGVKNITKYIKNQIDTAETYLQLLEEGIPPEDARFSLPIGTKTFLTTAMNAESLLHYFNVRSCFDSQWEIRTTAYAILAGCKLIHPILFDEETGPHCLTGRCKGRGNGDCKEDAEALINKLQSAIESYRSEFLELDSGDFLEIDLTEHLGYIAKNEIEEKVAESIGKAIDLSRPVKLKVIKK